MISTSYEGSVLTCHWIVGLRHVAIELQNTITGTISVHIQAFPNVD